MIDGGTGCAQRLVMAAVKRFEDLIVWQLAVAVRDAVYVLTGGGGASCDFAFRQQIRDSAGSAPRNIAEGFQRYNPPQFAQFMNIAKGSLAETQNHLLHGRHQGYFSEQEFTDAWRLTCRAPRAANRLHAYLRRCGKTPAIEPRRTP
jgi:four helix bundle protein